MLPAGHILGLDLATASFFTVDLPNGAGNHKLSHAQHSGLYLIDAAGFQLRVWHGNGLGQ
uniref:F-box protein AT5G49610-like beta-propeller domain-containing protein n=1 Tax=Arundo donax TaxID=35708 RepID=A0A0A8XTZ0_ARUDO